MDGTPGDTGAQELGSKLERGKISCTTGVEGSNTKMTPNLNKSSTGLSHQNETTCLEKPGTSRANQYLNSHPRKLVQDL